MKLTSKIGGGIALRLESLQFGSSYPSALIEVVFPSILSGRANYRAISSERRHDQTMKPPKLTSGYVYQTPKTAKYVKLN